MATVKTPPLRRGLPWWVWVGTLVLILAGAAFAGAARGVFTFSIGGTATASPEFTAQAVALVSPEATAPGDMTPDSPTTTDTATERARPTTTPTRRPTGTPAPTDAPAVAPTRTPAPPTRTPAPPTRTPSLTATRTPSQTFTPTNTPTRTPDGTATAARIAAIQTATATACSFSYEVVRQEPTDGDLFPANTAYERTLVLRNNGGCDWEPNTFLTYVEGESFSAGPRIFIARRVAVGEEVEMLFAGKTPVRGDTYTGVWELRTPNQRRIGAQMEITIRVYESG